MSRAPRGRLPLVTQALLFAATVAFGPLLLSAALFLRLPPEAPPLAPLGWPPALRGTHAILLEPGARRGWFVAPSPPGAAPAGGLVACGFELATLRASPCHALGLRPREARGALHHAFGAGSLLLVANEGADRGPLALRATLLRSEGPPLAGPLWTDEAGAAPAASLVNVAWNARAGRFEAYLARPNGDASYDLFVLPFAGASAAAAPERLALAGAGPALGAQPMAVTGSEPRGVVWATPSAAVYARGEERTPLPCRDPPFACVLVASPLALAGHYAGSGSLWFDGRGEVTPLAPYFDSSERWRQIVHVVARLSDDGGSSPLASRSVSDDRSFGRIEASDLKGNPVGVLVEHRGFEEVLVVVDPGGARHRVARNAHAPYNWTVVPHAAGLALFDFSSGRGVALDASYRVRVPRARLATLRDVLARRFDLGPLSVVAFLAALAAYPLLLLWAALARRGGRGDALAAALAAYVAVVAIFLLQNRAYIFPP
ncbi:MAG TPA: hypothetical protein VFS43_31635 [Polyangiaceae bacterium]|nr:hypothetical protein [Polyangiaceae bacterium]